MRIQLEIPEPDLEVIAEWLDARSKLECTSAQHDAISEGILCRIVAQFALALGIQKKRVPEAVRRSFEREYEAFERGANHHPHIPKARRLAGPGH